jgi:hypothetical protein
MLVVRISERFAARFAAVFKFSERHHDRHGNVSAYTGKGHAAARA